MEYTAHYDSPLGGITLASDGEALTGLWFNGQKHFGSTLGSLASLPAQLPVFDDTRRWLDIYFSSYEPDFTPPLSLQGTPFQRRVWEALLAIPYGQTVTYGELAHQLGCRSAQAIGGAVGRNPIAIIVPCHRIVGTNGSLTGYAGGLDRKRALLQLEQKIYFAF
jgi:methylated-DNA-[protein]-cysteine S-methyltransferase